MWPIFSCNCVKDVCQGDKFWHLLLEFRYIPTLLIFSLQKLKVFTASQIPLHFHCAFYSDPLHAVDHCTQFGLQVKPAFSAVN